jgi:TPP-dependent pyruvate/acetoin dehydrogenase alpha subunit
MSAETLQVPEIEISRDLARGMYDWLLRTRLFEDEIYYICANQTPQNPFICGKGYLSTGQEAISVGSAMALTPEDWFAQSHRDMGVHLHRGLTFLEALYQYRCTSKSPTRGTDGNVHFAKQDTNMIGFTSHMGQNAAVALGLAWAQIYRKTDHVVIATFGEGAAQQGIIHEAMNYAATFALPLIFIINNNRWAISVPVSEQMAIEDLAIRGAAYGMPSTIVDGNDTVAVYRATHAAVARARAGSGPALIECKSMRVMGHGSHDPATYVDEAEKAKWRARDPLVVMKAYLVAHDWLADAEDDDWRAKIKAEIDAAVDEAADDVAPDPVVATQGVYSEAIE